MVLGPHEQAPALLVHQQRFVAAGPREPEGPETMPGLELLGEGGALLKLGPRKLLPGPACCLSRRPRWYV